MRKMIIALTLLFVGIANALYVAVLETVSTKSAGLTMEDGQYLSDVLREQAVRALNPELFTIMTRENILMMLPPDKSMDECEGSCMVETGKNISAEYVAQGRVSRFGDNLTLTVELYKTSDNKLIGSFTLKSKNMDDLEEKIKAEGPGFFATIYDSEPELKAALEKQKLASEAASQVSENASENSGLHLPVWAKVIPYVLGAAAIGFGVYENTVADDEYGTYKDADFKGDKSAANKQWDKVQNAKTMRNVMYGVGAGLMAVGLTITIVF